MSARIPLRFEPIGKRRVPTVEVRIKLKEGSARLREAAMVDTGSAFTILSERLLHLSRFPTHLAKRAAQPVYGIGGPADLHYLEGAVVALMDSGGAFHAINLPRLFFTKSMHPPIFGRETLRSFNSRLNIDFSQETGQIEIG